MGYQIMTDEQWIEKMITCAREPSDYKNWFPFNLLYYSKGRRSADCSNLQKALLNGRDINDKTEGSYQRNLSATGDCTEYGLLMQCSDVTWGDFTKLKRGDPRILYMSGHIGAYLGREWDEPGQGIVNCVECTPAWEDGIQFSYVDSKGGRYWCKGGNSRGTWAAHGLASKWIIYTDEATQETIKKDISTVKEDVKGIHYGATDLAVMIIRNKYGNGYETRKNNLNAEGYSDDEVRAAQDIVNSTVRKANEQKAAAEQTLAVILAAYNVIAGAYGDGGERKEKLIAEYGEEVYDLIQAKVDELLG